MPSCAICGRTRNKKSKEDDITFHRLPQTTVQSQWLKFARDNGVHENSLKPSISLFCSRHFSASCFDKYARTTHLKSNAIPSIILKRIKYAKMPYPEIKTPIPTDDYYQSRSTPTCSEFTDQPIDKQINNNSESSSSTVIQVIKRPDDLTNETEVSSRSFKEMCLPVIHDSPNCLRLKRAVSTLLNKNILSSKKIKQLNQKVRRQKEKITSMKIIIDSLKKK